MKKILSLLLVMGISGVAYADSGASDSTLSITPDAVSGTTITAADENDRNGDVETWANAHKHQLDNTTKWGDGAAGNKYLCADTADAPDRCISWDDTNDVWGIDQVNAATYNTIIVQTGTTPLTDDDILIGTGDPGRIEASGINLHSVFSSVFGDISARAYNTGTIALPSGTATLVTLDSERFDTDSIHSTASNTSRLTATTAGKYQITGHLELAAGSYDPLGYIKVQILYNGTTVIASQDVIPVRFNAIPTTITIGTYYNMSTSDYVELRVTQTLNGSVNINASSAYSPEFEMIKVP